MRLQIKLARCVEGIKRPQDPDDLARITESFQRHKKLNDVARITERIQRHNFARITEII